MKERVQVLKQAIAPKPVVPTEAASPQHRSECQAALQSVNVDDAVLKGWRQYGTHVNVRVRHGFYRTDFEHKREIDRALRCVIADGREQDQGLRQVTYRDARSDQLVALWDKPHGFKMAE